MIKKLEFQDKGKEYIHVNTWEIVEKINEIIEYLNGIQQRAKDAVEMLYGEKKEEQ